MTVVIPIVTAGSVPALRGLRAELVARLAAVNQTMVALDADEAPPRPHFVDMEYPFRLQPDRAALKLARRRREATIWLAAAFALFLGIGGGDGYVAGRWAEARIEVRR